MGKPTTVTLKDLENFLSTPRIGGGLSKAAGALRRAEQERQAQRSVFNQPREPEWQPDHIRPGGHALEAPMISPDDLIGTGIPTKIAMALKGAAPLIGGLGVIKNKGGNWLSGSVEGALSGLKKRMDPELEGYARNGQNLMPHEAADVLPKIALNSFIDKQLTRYVKNEMATPEDPIRALAERGVLHIEPNMTRLQDLSKLRESLGFSAQPPSESTAAQYWNNIADASVFPRRSGELLSKAAEPSAGPLRERISSDRHWMQNVPKDTLINTWRGNQRDLGFDHLTDELANALNPESGLPRHLLLDPKSMDRVSVPQAVERVSQINAWRAAQKAEADMLRANNAATVVHKEYPEGQYWHGGNYRPGDDLTRPLYVSKNKGFANTYVDMAKERHGTGSLINLQHNANNPAPRELVEQEARRVGIDPYEGTPASIFDSELHGEESVKRLVDGLKKKGYDSAQLEDIAYGEPIEDTATVLFPGVKTSTSIPNPKGFKWVELRQPENATLPPGFKIEEKPYKDYVIKRVVDDKGNEVTGWTGHPGQGDGDVLKAFNREHGTSQLQDALKYEGDTMGHCVGGYCDDVASGRSRIYSLRDAKGQPHVTVEVAPKGAVFSDVAKYIGEDEANRLLNSGVTLREMIQNIPDFEHPQNIVQIKGKQNRAPNPEYLPFVQDFVKSGKWSDVRDLQNAGLQRAGWAPDVLERMKAHGIEAPEYGTADEINAALNALNKAKGFAHGGTVETKPFTVQDLQAIIAQINQEHINAA